MTTASKRVALTALRTALLAAATATIGGCLLSESDPATQGSGQTPDDGTGNSAPTISGTPRSGIQIGNDYSFTPTAFDADGDSLTFSVQNLPGWATFNTSNGNIAGTPTLGDVGSYGNIRVSVSDGKASASLPNFSISVDQIGTVSTTLSWNAPTENEDGSPLTDLAGYKLYYGTSSGNYSNEVTIDNPSVTTFVVENLTPNTYYFAATAFNDMGIESRYSGEAVRTLN